MDTERQVVYFPYLNLKDQDSLTIGNVEIWNFTKKKDEYIQDTNLKQKIEGILQMHKIGMQSIENMGVVSIGNRDFRMFNMQELEEIDFAKRILFISSLAKYIPNLNNLGASSEMTTSENFGFIVQNFRTGNDFLGERTGFIVTKTIVGYKIGVSEFQAPRFLPEPFSFSLDNEFKNQLEWVRNNRKRLFKRITNAIEIFLESYYNTQALSLNARILLQTSAFEFLLDFENRKDFKDKIEKYCRCPNEMEYIYSYEVGPKRKKEKRTLKGIWADRFYTLRNHIIHGDKVKDTDFLFKKQQQHFIIALLFFILCIKMLINNVMPKKVFYDSIVWDKWHDDMKNKDKVGFIYKVNVLSRYIEKYKVTRKV